MAVRNRKRLTGTSNSDRQRKARKTPWAAPSARKEGQRGKLQDAEDGVLDGHPGSRRMAVRAASWSMNQVHARCPMMYRAANKSPAESRTRPRSSGDRTRTRRPRQRGRSAYPVGAQQRPRRAPLQAREEPRHGVDHVAAGGSSIAPAWPRSAPRRGPRSRVVEPRRDDPEGDAKPGHHGCVDHQAVRAAQQRVCRIRPRTLRNPEGCHDRGRAGVRGTYRKIHAVGRRYTRRKAGEALSARVRLAMEPWGNSPLSRA